MKEVLKNSKRYYTLSSELVNDLRKLKTFVESSESIAILTHSNADPDAIMSSYALWRLVKYLNPQCCCRIVLHEGMNRVSKNAINTLGLSSGIFSERWDIDTKPSLAIVLDTASSTQLGNAIEYLRNKCVIIDHHAVGDLINKCELTIVMPTSKATSEIITYIYGILDIDMDPEIATALLTGIMFDSKHLSLADKDLMYAILYLLEKGASIQKSKKALHREMDISEKIARIKASLRVTAFRYRDLLIAITCVGAHEASVANALIELGYDAVFVVSSNDITRITFRTTQKFIKYSGINIAKDIIEPIARSFKGSGGGHELAGGAHCYASMRDVYLRIIQMLRDKLGENLREIGKDSCF